MRTFDSFLIFGGSGFIGTHLKSYLNRSFPTADVHLCDLRIVQEDKLNHRIDVRNPIQLEGDFGPQTLIFNLAAVHKTPGHPDREYFETNLLGAENICNFARNHSIQNIVFTSSIAPYGASETLKTEQTLPTPNTPYGISKLVAEKTHLTWKAESPDRAISIVRPGIVFGKGEGGNFTRLFSALRKGFFAYAGRKDTCKAAIYVKDLTRIMVEMAQNESRSSQLYNCCYPEPATIEAIVKSVQSVTGLSRPIPTIPSWVLKRVATLLGAFDAIGIGIHPDRVKKLMISTNISGQKLHQDYPLAFTLESAIKDWWEDCNKRELK